jgi:FtsZ-binding cell division protein ZapB
VHDAGSWDPPSTKGKEKALVRDTLEAEREEWEEQLNKLLWRLDQADVDPTLADLEENEVAQIVVRQLLDTINNLRKELEQEKRAWWDADTRLIQATHKRLNLQSPLTKDGEG